jgi:hypothetical protein
MSSLCHVISEADDMGRENCTNEGVFDEANTSRLNSMDEDNIDASCRITSIDASASNISSNPSSTAMDDEEVVRPDVDDNIRRVAFGNNNANMMDVEVEVEGTRIDVATNGATETETADLPQHKLHIPSLNNNSKVIEPSNTNATLQDSSYQINHPIHNRLMHDIPPTIQSLQQQYYSSSSLSGDEDDDEDEDEPLVQGVSQDRNNLQTIDTNAIQTEQQHRQILPRSTLSRMHSGSSSQSSSSQLARSSQNSSRDWGWFDDVHATTHSTEMVHTSGMSNARNGHDPIQNKNHHHHRVTNVDPSAVDDNVMAVTAPHYVLEESLSSQFLWKNSAGQRPPQPVEERAFYEKMWAQNFERSKVEYSMPVELLTATSPLSLDPFSDSKYDNDYAHHTVGTVAPIHVDGGVGTAGTDIAEAALVYRMNDDRNNDRYHNNNALHNYHTAPIKREVKDTSGDGTLTVLVRGDNVFGTTVSKSFARTNENGDPIAGVDTINISIASYRVVESSKHGKYAQFLVIYRQGSIRNTIGIWKRYRDFEELAHKVTQAHEGCVAAFAHMSPLHVTSTGDDETEHLPNAITSWRLLKKRKRWYRCLDAGYLSLKVFLLERFLHDILFESSSPHLLRDFVGVDTVPQMF